MALSSDNIISKVARVSLSERVSSKTNKPFVIMTIYFKNGLQIDNFVDKRDWFGLQDLLDNTNKNGTMADNPLDLDE
jgi:sRNA-binding regulator protein Hfq